MPSVPATDDQFFDSLRGEDELGAVVRAHIHIEARLNQVVEALTPHPKHLPNLRYEQRLRLAVALGLNDQILAPLKILGDIRNEFGHRLDTKLTQGMVDKLFKSFAPDDSEVVRSAYQTTQSQLPTVTIPPFEKAGARTQFVMIAVALDKYLILAEREARQRDAPA